MNKEESSVHSTRAKAIDGLGWLELAALGLAAVPAVLGAWNLARVFAGRLRYGIDAELMESGTLLQAYRLNHGLPLYTDPGSAFMPYPYPPLHSLVIAALARVFGLSFALGRAVSVASVVVVAALLLREVYLQLRPIGSSPGWALLALGFIAAGFPLTGGLYDVARVDSFALSLVVSAAVVVLGVSVEPTSKRRFAAAASLLVAIVFTKQTHVLYVAWLLLFLAFERPRLALRLAATVGAASLVVTGLLQEITHGNYWFYTVSQLTRHELRPKWLVLGATMLVEFAPYLLLMPVLAVLLATRSAVSRRTRLWLGILSFAIPATLLPFAKIGGSVNNFIPIAVLSGPVLLCVLGDVFSALASRPVFVALVRSSVALACGAYLLARGFDPVPYMENPRRAAAVHRMNAFVAGLGGGVLLPMRPYTAILSGERLEQIDAVPWFDYSFTNPSSRPFHRFLDRTKPRWIILTGEEPANLVLAMADSYFLRDLTPPDTWNAELLPGGSFHAPFVLERDSSDPPGTRCLFDFESGGYEGFELTGTAFGTGPVRFRPPSDDAPPAFGFVSVVVGGEGSRLASSAGGPGGDGAVGTLETPEFVLDGSALRLRFAGPDRTSVRVELRIGGEVARTATGSGSEYMRDVHWNVDAERGKRARLRVVDEDVASGGHALLDRVRLTGSDGKDGWCTPRE